MYEICVTGLFSFVHLQSQSTSPNELALYLSVWRAVVDDLFNEYLSTYNLDQTIQHPTMLRRTYKIISQIGSLYYSKSTVHDATLKVY
jgi:hypothetical protein